MINSIGNFIAYCSRIFNYFLFHIAIIYIVTLNEVFYQMMLCSLRNRKAFIF